MALFVMAALPLNVYAARSEGIAVVVNEDVITFSDVQDRVLLTIASSGLPNTEETHKRLTPQIVGALVDEQVRLQEAARLELGVTQGEIAEGFAVIAEQNNFEPADFRKRIVKGGLNIKTLEGQIRSQIAWNKVVQASLRPQVVISDGDVESHLQRLSENTGKAEYLAAEIFLPVDKPQDEPQTRQLAQELVQEIRAGKAPFFVMAQQFSKAAGAAQGGDLGWVSQGQLSEELDAILPNIGKGQVASPVRTASGFHILSVREKRVMTQENLPQAEQIRSLLGAQRLERLQRRYFLDLKSAAFIENRMGL